MRLENGILLNRSNRDRKQKKSMRQMSAVRVHCQSFMFLQQDLYNPGSCLNLKFILISVLWERENKPSPMG